MDVGLSHHAEWQFWRNWIVECNICIYTVPLSGNDIIIIYITSDKHNFRQNAGSLRGHSSVNAYTQEQDWPIINLQLDSHSV